VQRRDRTFDRAERLTAVRFQVGHGVQKSASIGMGWRVENLMFGAEFDDASGIHYGDAVGDLRNNSKIMRDEEHGEVELGAEFGEQGENLRLDRDIECGGGFVGDKQLRMVHDGHGDHNALAHAAGELVRIVAGASGGIRDGDIIHGIDCALPRLALRHLVVRQHGFRDLIAHPHDGIERRHGLLENHRDARAAELAHGVVRKIGEIASHAIPGEVDFARDVCLSREQAHDGKGCDRFAGAGFADQAQNFAGCDGEVEIADGRQGSSGDSPGLCRRKFYVQVADVEKREHDVMLAAFDRTLAPADHGQPKRLSPDGL